MSTARLFSLHLNPNEACNTSVMTGCFPGPAFSPLVGRSGRCHHLPRSMRAYDCSLQQTRGVEGLARA